MSVLTVAGVKAVGISGASPKIVLPKDVLLLSEANITQSGKTVLGHWDPKTGGYITKAEQRGASYFDLGSRWDGLTAAQRTAANQHFLDVIAARGDDILLSVPKTKIRYPSALADEIKYLTEEKGYSWVNQWSLKKVR